MKPLLFKKTEDTYNEIVDTLKDAEIDLVSGGGSRRCGGNLTMCGTDYTTSNRHVDDTDPVCDDINN